MNYTTMQNTCGVINYPISILSIMCFTKTTLATKSHLEPWIYTSKWQKHINILQLGGDRDASQLSHSADELCISCGQALCSPHELTLPPSATGHEDGGGSAA
jgi:hypothetical protein